MPLLVRSSLTASPPLWLSTVSERCMRGRAAAMMASHSSGEQVAEHHDARVAHAHQHMDIAIAGMDAAGIGQQIGLGHA
jgi:hypothetical protein